MEKATIYPHSVEYAIQHGEAPSYHQCLQESQACARAIDKAVIASNYELYHYDLKAAAKTVIEEFGFERTNFVLANILLNSHYDGRYSHANKEWAQGFHVAPDRYIVCNTHPTVLDGFIDRVRKAHVHMMAQEVGQYEKSHRIALRNRLTYFHSDFGEFVAHTSVTQERLTERHNEIMERKAARRASAVERLAEAKRAVKPPAPGASGKKKDLEVE